jgi:hypothetical protein
MVSSTDAPDEMTPRGCGNTGSGGGSCFFVRIISMARANPILIVSRHTGQAGQGSLRVAPVTMQIVTATSCQLMGHGHSEHMSGAVKDGTVSR